MSKPLDRESDTESTARYRALAEHASDMVAERKVTGELVYLSPNHVGRLGYTEAELRAFALPDIVHPEDQAALGAHFEVLCRTGGAAPVEYRLKHKDGAWHWYETNASSYRTADDELRLIGITRDIHARREAEAALRRSEEHLRRSQKMEALGRLAGGIAHDFNNLLLVVSGASRLALGRLDDQTFVRSQIDAIEAAAKRAADLVRHLMTFSRRQTSDPRALSLALVVRSLEPLLARLVGEDVALAIEALADVGAVRSDQAQLEQVIINLAMNARDAMPHGGRLEIIVENARPADLQARALAAGDYVSLTMRDTGHGMTDDVLAHVFEPFFTTKEPGQGTGFGLATTCAIVEQNAGRIFCTSRIGEGTTFSIYLPRHVSPDRPDEVADPSSSAEARAAAWGGDETVLVVEDQDEARQLIRMILESGGYRVLEAPRADAALSLLEKHDGPVDLLLTDVVMPGMDGPTLAARVSAARPSLRVLYMSGYGAGRCPPGSRLLSKPFGPAELDRAIRETLAPGETH